VTGEGIQVVDPRHLVVNEIPPPVRIEQVTADRKTYDIARDLRLPLLARDLQVDFTALSLVAPEKVRFRYKLEGYDNDWQDSGNRRQAFYTNLPPRSYRFRVMAANNSGLWNEAGATLEFSIAPAYYQTRRFQALVVALALGLMWAGYVVRVRQVARQYQRRLDERVNERTRIARDLHDGLLQSFHALVLKFQTVLKLLPDRPADARQRLEAALAQADDAITEGRNAVQGLRTSTLEQNDLANAIRSLGDELVRESTAVPPLGFAVVVEGHSRELHPIARDEIYKIAAEAVRNAFQHAQARHIDVDIRYDYRRFRLVVRDDGHGIEPAVLAASGKEGHYGLRGMRERASVIGGQLAVWSEPNIGTEVELSVPARAAYARTSQASPVVSNVDRGSWT
jgi:signal transduction histidine kinase